MYNSKYGIKFEFNPIMMCILGQFNGWSLVIDAFNNTRELREGDKVLFTFRNKSQFDKLVKHIKNN